MAMKCPMCASQFSETSLRRTKRGLGILAILVILIVAGLAVYWMWPWPYRIDSTPFLMPNTLASSVLQDGMGSPGGIIAVYGNISNPESRSINPLVSIHINMSSNWTSFVVRPGFIDPGDHVYFSWVHHFDHLDAGSINVTLRVWGNS